MNVPDFDQPIGLAIHDVLHSVHNAISMSLVYALPFGGGTMWLQPIRVLACRTTVEKFLANF